MFDIGWPEMLVIAIVLIVVVGPKDLPRMLRTFGRTTTKLRGMAGDFRKQFDEALKEAELDDVKTMVSDARKLDPRNKVREALSPMQKAAADVRSGLDAAMNPKKPAPAPDPAAPEAKAVAPAKTGATAMPGEGAAKQVSPEAKGANGLKAPTKTAAKPSPSPKSSTAPAAKPAAPAKAASGTKAAAKAKASAASPRKPASKPKPATGGKGASS